MTTATKTTKKTPAKKPNRYIQGLKNAKRREKTENPSVEEHSAAVDSLIDLNIKKNEKRLKELQKSKPTRGRPRVNKSIPEKTRSVTLTEDLWQLIGVDAEKEIRSANGQIEWIIRQHYNYYPGATIVSDLAPDMNFPEGVTLFETEEEAAIMDKMDSENKKTVAEDRKRIRDRNKSIRLKDSKLKKPGE